MENYSVDDFTKKETQNQDIYSASDFTKQDVLSADEFTKPENPMPSEQNMFSRLTEGVGKALYGAANTLNPVNILARQQDKRLKEKKPLNENVEGLIGALRGVNTMLPASEPSLGEIQGNMGTVESIGNFGAGLTRNILPAAAGALAGGPAGAGAGMAASNMSDFERAQRVAELQGGERRNRNVYDELSMATDIASGGLANKLGALGKIGKAAVSDVAGGALSALYQTEAEGGNLDDPDSVARIALSAALPAVMHGASSVPKIKRSVAQVNGTKINSTDIEQPVRNTMINDLEQNGISGIVENVPTWNSSMFENQVTLNNMPTAKTGTSSNISNNPMSSKFDPLANYREEITLGFNPSDERIGSLEMRFDNSNSGASDISPTTRNSFEYDPTSDPRYNPVQKALDDSIELQKLKDIYFSKLLNKEEQKPYRLQQNTTPIYGYSEKPVIQEPIIEDPVQNNNTRWRGRSGNRSIYSKDNTLQTDNTKNNVVLGRLFRSKKKIADNGIPSQSEPLYIKDDTSIVQPVDTSLNNQYNEFLNSQVGKEVGGAPITQLEGKTLGEVSNIQENIPEIQDNINSTNQVRDSTDNLQMEDTLPSERPSEYRAGGGEVDAFENQDTRSPVDKRLDKMVVIENQSAKRDSKLDITPFTEGNIDPSGIDYDRMKVLKRLTDANGYDSVMGEVYGASVWDKAVKSAGNNKELAARTLIEQDPKTFDAKGVNYLGISTGRIDPAVLSQSLDLLHANKDKLVRSNNLDPELFNQAVVKVAETLPFTAISDMIANGEGQTLIHAGVAQLQHQQATDRLLNAVRNNEDITEHAQHLADALISTHASASNAGAMLSVFSKQMNNTAERIAAEGNFQAWKERVAPSILDSIYREGTMRDMTVPANKERFVNDLKELYSIKDNQEDSQDQVYRFLAKKARESGLPEATLAKSMYSSLLSPKTFLSVVAGNTSIGLMQGLKNALTTAQMAPKGQKLSSAWDVSKLQLSAILGAMGESKERGQHAWKYGFGMDAWKGVTDISDVPSMFRALGWSDDKGITEGTARKVANTLNIPMRSVIAADELTRTFAEKMAAISYAYQEVMKKGKLPKEEFAKQVSDLIANPSTEMRKFVTDAGQEASLQKEIENGTLMHGLKKVVQSSAMNPMHDGSIKYNIVDGKRVYTNKGQYTEVKGKYFTVPKLAQKALGERQRINWLRPLAPFANMTGNMANVGVDYSPASFLKALRMATTQKRGADVDMRKMQEYISKGAIGTALMGLGALSQMQLGGNKDKNMQNVDRAMNIPYDNVDLGGASIAMDKFGPAAIPMIGGWFTRQLVDAATMPQEELDVLGMKTRGEAATDAGFRAAKALSGTIGFEGALSAANALNGDKGAGGRLIGTAITPFIPMAGTSKMINSIIDPDVRKNEGLADTLQQTLPLGSLLVPNRRSPMGDIQKRPNSLLTALGVSLKSNDPVYSEMRRLGVPFDKQSNTVDMGNGANMQLSQEEMNQLYEKIGPARKQAVEMLINSDGYKQLSDDAKRFALRQAISESEAIKVQQPMITKEKQRMVLTRPRGIEETSKSISRAINMIKKGYQ